jgi:hypothetical protein
MTTEEPTEGASDSASDNQTNAGNGVRRKEWSRGQLIAAFAAILTVVAAIVGPLSAAVAGYVVSQSEAQSAAIDQATGAARAYLVIFEEMQGALDSMIHWQQKILPPVSNDAWNVSLDDLKSLGVVLTPTTHLLVVERASQKLNSVFPSTFHGLPARSAAAHALYLRFRYDMMQADKLVRCAEIYLGRVVGVGPDLHGKVATQELERCSTDFPTHSPA